MTTKGKLKAFFDTEKESLKLIDKYEENINFFNDLLKNGHTEDVEFVIPIKMYNYAYSLEKKGYYTKALSIAYEIEKDIERLRGQSKWYEMYSEGVMFLKGMCLERLKKYKESNKYFEQLIKIKPTNDNFINWYKSNIQNQIQGISNIISITAFVIVVLCIVVNLTKILNFRIPAIIEAIFWIIAIIAMVFPYIWKKFIDKKIQVKTNKKGGG